MSQKWFEGGNTDTSLSKKELHDALISTAWLVYCSDGDGGEMVLGSGFCVDPQGHILTCYHTVESSPLVEFSLITCVSMGTDAGGFAAKVIRNSPNWDMALLELQDTEDKRFDYVKMADIGDRILCGQDIYSIGNPSGVCRSFMIGKVTYPCDGYNLDKLVEVFSEARYDYTHRGRYSDPMELHRKIGNIASESESKNHPDVPLIQTSGFSSVYGSSGSPVFDSRGYVIGMMIKNLGRHGLAVHFCALNHFIHNYPHVRED